MEIKSSLDEQETQPNQVEIPTEYAESNRFKLNNQLRISVAENESLYTQHVIEGTSAKVNRLAVTNDYRSKNFNYNKLVSQKNYAQVGNNSEAHPSLNSDVSNEMVKVGLTREFLKNPEVYTTATISTLINKLESEYAFTPEEIEMLSDKSKKKERASLIEFASKKLNKGDAVLSDTIKTIDYLMENQAKIEEAVKTDNSFAIFAEQKLKDEMNQSA